MKNTYYLVEKIECDPNKLTTTDLRIVSFKREVLNKYNNEKYLLNLNQDVGLLSEKNVWSIPVDVQDDIVNTLLYKLADLPDDDQKHFFEYNIHPQNLSPTSLKELFPPFLISRPVKKAFGCCFSYKK